VELTKVLRGRDGYPVFDSRQYLHLRKSLEPLAQVVAMRDSGRMAWVAAGTAREVPVMKVSSGYFAALGIPPVAGREFSAQEDLPGGAGAAVVSARFWRQLSGRNEFASGRSANLGGVETPVVGVLGEDFPDRLVDVYLPMQVAAVGDGDNTVVFARLRDGVAPEQVSVAGTAAFQELLRASYPKYSRDLRLELRPYGNLGRRGLRTPLYVLSAAVALILCIACANLANLLLARASTRQREMAIRASLGAGRLRLARQMLTESVLLSCGGAVAGLLIARAAIPLMLRMSPLEGLGVDTPVSIDWAVLAFTALVAVGTGLLFGLAPALFLGRLSQQGRDVKSGVAFKRALVIGEVALSFVLLAGAGLMLQSLERLLRAPSGVAEARVIAGKMSLRGDRYNTAAKAAALFERGMDRLGQIAAVEAVAVTLAMPLERGINYAVVVPDAVTDGRDRPEQPKFSNWRYVTPNYFAVMGIALRQGRGFEAVEPTRVAIVSESFARKYLGTKNPLGRVLIERSGEPLERTIVGVVADVKANSLREDSPPTVYVPVRQAQDDLVAAAHTWFPMTWVIRTRDAAGGAAGEVERAMREVDPLLPFQSFQTMKDMRDELARLERSLAWLMTAFAVLAMLLAAAGLYGVIGFVVTRRVPELGVRMALGAPAQQLALGVVAQCAGWCAVGVAVGVIGTLALRRGVESYLYGVAATDWSALAMSGLVLLLIGALAAAGPALRVLRMDPLAALRQETS
jgi:predicted permease